MAGIYLHIPFCKQACHYCNFHFSTSLKHKAELVQAIGQELVLRKAYLAGAPISSVYLGGGTPSLLDEAEMAYLFDTISKHYQLQPGAEVTLEANPDDIHAKNLALWRDSPINRLSIGIQSFFDADLQYMNRAHNAAEAQHCIQQAQAVGFDNLTVDLIYGTPTMTDAAWAQNVRTVLELGIKHISCYALTVEPKTALEHRIRQQKALPVDEEQAARQFEQLMEWLTAAGFLHYEISNFAQPNHLALHNSSYWQGAHYMGVGPSAHSYNGTSRQWNVANNAHYIKAIQGLASNAPAVVPLFDVEMLSPADRYNETVMTGLRTIWGVDPDALEAPYQAHFLNIIQQFVDTSLVKIINKKYVLTTKGRLLADGIASAIFY